MDGTSGGHPYRSPDGGAQDPRWRQAEPAAPYGAARPWSVAQEHQPSWGYGPPAHASYGNSKGSTGMTLGIIACCTWWIPFLYLVTAVPMGILAIVFGNQGRRLCQQGLASNRGQCDAATWTGIAALVLSALSAVLGVLLFL